MGGLAQWIMNVVETLGYLGLAALIALENLFPPLPSELILPLAGFLTGRGEMSFPLAIAAATVGSVSGAVVLYGLGIALGEERLRKWVRAHGRWVLISESDLDRSRDWFDRHGGAAVFFGRLIPGIRSFISIPAGVEKMPLWRFCLLTTTGSALWNTALIAAGWILGDQWHRVRAYTSVLEYVVLALLVVALGVFIARRVRARGHG